MEGREGSGGSDSTHTSLANETTAPPKNNSQTCHVEKESCSTFGVKGGGGNSLFGQKCMKLMGDKREKKEREREQFELVSFAARGMSEEEKGTGCDFCPICKLHY